MIDFELYTEVTSYFSMFDAEEVPEVVEYLESIMDIENEAITQEPYVIANEVLRCDKGDALPEIVCEFIEAMFERAYTDGVADAMNDLGAHYYDGSRGFEQDFTKAVECYKRAAEKGSRQAQENLGYCYYYGRNMPVDYEKAFHYFALGAFDGHLISLYKIGDMYANGYYVPKNETEAFYIYTHCMDTMTDEAAPFVAGPVLLRLGKCYLKGLGTEKNAKSALICYQKAEAFLYDMVRRGDYMYKKSMQAAIDGQEKARQELEKDITDREWLFD